MPSMATLADSKKFTLEKVIENFEAVTMDAERIQTKTLENILKQNGETEYLRKLGLNGRTDPKSFKECVPISTYNDYEDYINRIVEGDSSPLMTGKPLTSFTQSSGTTKGTAKFIPFNDDMMNSVFDLFYTSFAYRNRDFPIDEGKTLQFIYGKKVFRSHGGLSVGTVTNYVFSSPLYETYTNATKTYSCSPQEVIFSSDFHQSLYCHILCGLLFRDQIQYVYAHFASNILSAFHTFEQVWEEMCDIIRTGILPDKINNHNVRASMLKLLKPNPQLADLIHQQCSELSNWYGLIPALFPNIKYVYGIMTGSMETYLEKIRHYAGNVPLISGDYGSSETVVASNVDPKLAPEDSIYTVHPSVGFFEFIPRNETETGKNKDPVGLTEVKVGEEYELVVTSFTGLYRYELGDAVKVMGFHNKSPKLKFLCRSSLLLNLTYDKTTEKEIQEVVRDASKLLADEKVQLIDFSSMADVSTNPPHYVIFWELNDGASDDRLLECCNALDLGFVDVGYVNSRKDNTIGPLELRVVRKGTFNNVLEHFVGLGTSLNQYKTPRCVSPSNKKMFQILTEGLIKSLFSTNI